MCIVMKAESLEEGINKLGEDAERISYCDLNCLFTVANSYMNALTISFEG